MPGFDPSILPECAPPLPEGARYLVCYSGGCDSSALLHALHAAGIGPLQAVHVHHGLQPEADEWVAHCTAFCSRLRVPLTVLRVDVDHARADGPEDAARRARYAALRECMAAGDCLVLAHHRDDQAETVLLRLLRGGGDGLSAMRTMTPFAPGRLWRPLLKTARASLRDYANRHRLEWVEDPQNRDTRFTRVWLRREILSALSARVPHAAAALATAADHVARQVALQDEVAAADLAPLLRGEQGAVDIPGLSALSPLRRANVLRAWLRRADFAAPGPRALERLGKEVLGAARDAVPVLRIGACELRRYRNCLYAMAPLPPAPDDVVMVWEARLEANLPAACGSLCAPRPPPVPLTVRFVRAGDVIRPSGSAHARTLKNLFQEAGVPPWRRCRTPLVELGGQPAWLPDVAHTSEWEAFCKRHVWVPDWTGRPSG